MSSDRRPEGKEMVADAMEKLRHRGQKMEFSKRILKGFYQHPLSTVASDTSPSVAGLYLTAAP